MQVKKKPKKTAKAVPEKSRKKKQPGEGQIKKQPFLKRMLFGEEKPDLSELEAGSTTILDILSPTTVDTKSRDYIIVDDVYHAYLYITGYGYTTTVGTCWLAPLVEAGGGDQPGFSRQASAQGKDPLQNCSDHHGQPLPYAGCRRYAAGLRGTG